MAKKKSRVYSGLVVVAIALVAMTRPNRARASDGSSALGFESTADWSLAAGAGTIASVAPLSEGSHALRIDGSGWRELRSNALALGAVGPLLRVDVAFGGNTSSWETVGAVIEVPSAGIYWQDLGTRSAAGMSLGQYRAFEFDLPDNVRASLQAGAEAHLRFSVNSSHTVTFDNATLTDAPPPPSPPNPGGPSSPVCTARDLAITDIRADFSDIWAGREDVATGKRTSFEPVVGLSFNQPVESDRLLARMVGLTVAGGDCVTADGEVAAGDTLHEVRLVGDFGAEAWQTPLSLSGVGQSAPLDFNLVAFGSVSGVPDVQGAIAVGGNLDLQSFSVNASSHKPAGLVVGGHLSAANGTIYGDLYRASGTVSLQSVNLNGNQIHGLPFHFDELESALGSMSEVLAGREANGSVSSEYSQLFLTGSEPSLNVFDVTANQLAAASSVLITVPSGATVLVNVRGETVTIENLQITLSGASRSALLWNLPDATLFKLRSISFQGSALAPSAVADVSNGNFEGTLVAQSVIGNMQFHDFPLTAWAALGAATLSTSVSLRTDARLRAGCEYTLIVEAFPATPAGNCLPGALMQSFLVADNAKSRFDREMGFRRLRRSPNLPVSFTALPGINTRVPDVFTRYAETLELRPGLDTLAPAGVPVPSRSHVGLDVVRYRQLYRGVPVEGYGYLLFQDGEVFRSAVGQLLPGLELSPVPTLSEQQAIDAALVWVNPAERPWEIGGGSPPAGELLIQPTGYAGASAEAALIWRVHLFEIPEGEFADVDAHSGAVVFVQPRTRSISTCPGFDRELAMLDHHEDRAIDVPFNNTRVMPRTDLRVGIWRHADTSFEVFQNMDPLRFRTRHLLERAVLAESVLTESVCAGSDAETQQVARAHWAVQNAERAFHVLFDWSGLRGDPAADNLSVTVVNSLPANESRFVTRFMEDGANGDRIFVRYPDVFPTSVAHEFAHGVLRYSRADQGFAPLFDAGESGALEEAYSDILAVLATHEQNQEIGADPWCLVGPNGAGCYRNLADPKIDSNPDTYQGEYWQEFDPGNCTFDNDNCGIHLNATVVGHWFHALANGRDGSMVNDLSCASSVNPLLPDLDESLVAAGQVVFDAFAIIDASASFRAARDLTAAVAEAKLGDVEARYSVEKAWHAVGVGEGPTPLLFEPLDGATEVEPWSTRFRFTVGSDQGPWTLRYSTDPTFTSANYHTIEGAIVQDGIRYAQAFISLNADTKYYWQAREGGLSPGADWDRCGTFTGSFTTAKKLVNIRIPSSTKSGGYYLTNNMGQVAWEPVARAWDYEALLRDTNDGCTVPASEWTEIPLNLDRITHPELFLGDTIDQNAVLLRDPVRVRPELELDPNVTYHLYIRARSSTGAKGSCNHFKVRKLKLLPFEKLSPLDYVDVPYDSGGPFVWTPSIGADRYEFTLRRWPPGGAQEPVLHTIVRAADAPINGDGNVEYRIGDTSATTLPGEMIWDVWAVHESGDKRAGWDPGAPGLTSHARFWNAADRIVEGVTEGGVQGPPVGDVTPITLVVPHGTENLETQTCFKAPGNTIGMLWYFAEGGTVGWDDLIDTRIAPGTPEEYPLCTSPLSLTHDSMYLLAIPYSNVIVSPSHEDWRSGFGPQSIFNIKVQYCGGVDELCCENASCLDGAICDSLNTGTCIACGGGGQPCCQGDTCDGGFICKENQVGAMRCHTCGDPGESCCEGGVCASYATCASDGLCARCGGLNEPCCAGGACRTSNTACNGVTCEALQQCNDVVQSGTNSPSSFDMEMGNTQGSSTLRVNTYAVKDNISVYYEDELVVGTGCVGTKEHPKGCFQGATGTFCCDKTGWCTIPFRYGPGASTSVVVEVQPNCDGTSDTDWEFEVACPN